MKILGIDFYLRKHEKGTRQMAREALDERAIGYACSSGLMHISSQIGLETAS
jgi:hypothetical protein